MKNDITQAIKFNGNYIAIGDIVKVTSGYIPDYFSYKKLGHSTFEARIVSLRNGYICFDLSEKFKSNIVELKHEEIVKIEPITEED